MSADQNTLRVRPRFRFKLNVSQADAKEKILKALEGDRASWNGKIVDNHVIIKVPQDQQHYWSPQLSLELEQQEETTLVRGLFGPKPGVWTMFVFFYSAFGFLTLMGLIFGLSQMMLKMEPYGLWSVPVGTILLVGLFIISKIGQRLGQEQMNKLNSLLLSVFSESEIAES